MRLEYYATIETDDPELSWAIGQGTHHLCLLTLEMWPVETEMCYLSVKYTLEFEDLALKKKKGF